MSTQPSPLDPSSQQAVRITVERSRPRYVAQMEALQRRVYAMEPDDTDGILLAQHFLHHQAIFPEGQFVALDHGRVVGLTVSMRLAFDPERPFIEPWLETIGGGWLTRHDPAGEWMYGVESCVDPDYQGRGIGGALIEARFQTARELNLRGMVAGSALISYAEVSPEITPEQYVDGVISGRFFDRNLSKQLRKGFRVCGLIPNYVDDESTRGWGAVIVWHNPDYDPAAARRPAVARRHRYRMTLRQPLHLPAAAGLA